MTPADRNQQEPWTAELALRPLLLFRQKNLPQPLYNTTVCFYTVLQNKNFPPRQNEDTRTAVLPLYGTQPLKTAVFPGDKNVTRAQPLARKIIQFRPRRVDRRARKTRLAVGEPSSRASRPYADVLVSILQPPNWHYTQFYPAFLDGPRVPVIFVCGVLFCFVLCAVFDCCVCGGCVCGVVFVLYYFLFDGEQRPQNATLLQSTYNAPGPVPTMRPSCGADWQCQRSVPRTRPPRCRCTNSMLERRMPQCVLCSPPRVVYSGKHVCQLVRHPRRMVDRRGERCLCRYQGKLACDNGLLRR